MTQPTPIKAQRVSTSEAEARAVLQKELEARVLACHAEIEAALQKHGLAFDVSVTVSASGVVPNLRLLPNR